MFDSISGDEIPHSLALLFTKGMLEMKSYFVLALSITFEIFGTAMLKASDGFSVLFPSIGVVISYGISFYFFSLALKMLPLSLAYAIWAGLGTALTALVGVFVWGEILSLLKLSGLALIIGGVILLNFTSSTKKTEQQPSLY